MSMSQASAPQRAPHAKYQRLIERAKGVPAGKTLVVYPCDESSLRGTIEAAEIGIIVPTLVGPVAKMKAVAQQHGLDISRLRWSKRPTAMKPRQRRSSSSMRVKVSC